MSVWIESHKSLKDHWKTAGLQADMGWDLDQTIGKLHRFWWWCVDYCENGDLRKFNDAIIGSAAGLSGEDCKRFVDAMKRWRFIDEAPYFRVHEWWGYVKHYLRGKYRKSPKVWESVRDAYEGDEPAAKDAGTGKKEEPKPETDDSGLPGTTQVPRKYGDTYLPTYLPTNQGGGEVEDDGATRDPLSVIEVYMRTHAVPHLRQSEDFWKAFGTWILSRRQKVGVLNIRGQLDELAKLSLPDAIEGLKKSVANGWSGVFPPKRSANGSGRPSPVIALGTMKART